MTNRRRKKKSTRAILFYKVYRIIRKIKIFLGSLFYKLGCNSEYLAVRTWRKVKYYNGYIRVWAKNSLGQVNADIISIFTTAHSDIKKPAVAAQAKLTDFKDSEDKSKKGVWKKIKGGSVQIKTVAPDYLTSAKMFLKYSIPFAALCTFLLVVTVTMNRNFLLEVEYKGQIVGYIEQEAVYESAEKMVNGRIVSVDGNQNDWSMKPTFSIVDAEKTVPSNTETLANEILEKSGAEIAEAVGLYVDNTFYGAITENALLQQDIDSIKKPYQEENPGDEIGFVQNVEIKDGIYLTDTIVDYNKISTLLNSQIQAERNYVIQRGDTPISVAGDNNITINELYALNPQIEDGDNMPVGMNVVISGPQSFLQVKVVETIIEQEPIRFNIVKENDDKLAYGVQKVTRKGSEGIDDVTYTYTYIDGVLVNKNEVSRATAVGSVDEIVSVGTYVSSTGSNIPLGTGPYMFPVGRGYKYMSRGFSGAYAHNGLDLCGYMGTPIYAAQSGMVIKAVSQRSGYGVHVVIDHGAGMQTLYGHNSSLAVGYGQYVEKGQVIAYLGNTGNSSGPHCHFEVIKNGRRVNPMTYLG